MCSARTDWTAPTTADDDDDRCRLFFLRAENIPHIPVSGAAKSSPVARSATLSEIINDDLICKPEVRGEACAAAAAAAVSTRRKHN